MADAESGRASGEQEFHNGWAPKIRRAENRHRVEPWRNSEWCQANDRLPLP